METTRLVIRSAELGDVDLYFDLWTNSEVMTYVGFPDGLKTTHEAIRNQIETQGTSEFDQLLVVRLKETDQALGECRMHRPNRDGIAKTDIKLLPQFWGHKYGIEVKRALLDYLFANTDCVAVEATPNVNNRASIRMQEAVGGVRVGAVVFEFPDEMRSYTTPVHHYIYRVDRSRRQS